MLLTANNKMNTNETTYETTRNSKPTNDAKILSGAMESPTNSSTLYGQKQTVQFVGAPSGYTSTTATEPEKFDHASAPNVTWPLGSMNGQNGESKLKSTSVGMKFDSEKPRVDLLDPLALEGLAAVLGFGSRKYAAHNWRGGISYSRLLGAALRHAFAILRGEDNDPESGLPHVDHLGCCWMFLSSMMKTRPDMDDRWKGNNAG